MGQRSVRVVVGRGDPSGADIRAMLERDGYLIVGEASTVEDLARLVQANPPDVAVLDDAIGVAAVQAVSELAPETKLVVIWPASVLPIAGATRIDAADLHTTLAPAVAAAAGLLAGLTSIDRPEWIDAVRKDPASLREKLAASSGLPVRPSVTELQRPHGYRAPSTGWRRRSSRPVAPAAAAAAASVTPLPTPDEDATVNRRLGMIALGGAVAAGALMIALSFGRPTPTVVSAEPFVPGISGPSNFIPEPAGGDTTGGGGGTAPGGTQGGGGNGPTAGTNGGSSTTSPDGSGTTSGTPTIGAGSSGGGSGGDVRTVTHQSASHPGTGGTGGQGSQGGGGGGQGPGSQTPGAPGNSGDHNPHGGPPGQTGDHPGQGGGQRPSHPVHPSDQQVHRHKR